MPRSRRNVPLITLFLVLFTVSVGFGLVIPILPLLAREFGASAFLLGLMTASYAVVQFLFAPIWGQVSDRVGRKKVLMIGITGLAFSFLLMGFAKSYWMLFTARVLGGFLSSATLPAAQAMAAELSGTKNRRQGNGSHGGRLWHGLHLWPADRRGVDALGLFGPLYHRRRHGACNGGAIGLGAARAS